MLSKSERPSTQAGHCCSVYTYDIPLEFVNKSSLGYNAYDIYSVHVLHLKDRAGKQPKARSKNVKSAMNIVRVILVILQFLDWRDRWVPLVALSLLQPRLKTVACRNLGISRCHRLPGLPCATLWCFRALLDSSLEKEQVITIKSSTLQNANLPSSATDRPETRPCHVAWAGADSTSCLRGRVFLSEDLSQSTTVPSQLT